MVSTVPLPTTARVSRPFAWGYGAAINDLLVRLAFAPERRGMLETAALQAERFQTAETPEDLVDDVAQVFSRVDFSGGEGLDRAHRRNGTETDWSRFWDSKNVDVSRPEPGQPHRLRLLHAASRERTLSSTPGFGCQIGTRIFVANGAGVEHTADPLASSPSWTVDDPHNGEGATTVNDVACLGDEVYAALVTNGIHRRSSGGTWSHWNDLVPSRMWGVKGRIMAAAGTSLYEVTASGAAPAALKTLASGESWTAVADGGSAIFCAATDGYIYAYADDGGTLTLVEQYRMPTGEYAVMVGLGAARRMLIGTAELTQEGGKIGRLYEANVTASSIQDLQLLREWDPGTAVLDMSPYAFVASRDSAYTAVVASASETHLWRYDMVTGGMIRDLVLTTSGVVRSLYRVNNRLLGVMTSSGIYRELTSYPAEGYLISPFADFYSSETKSWSTALMRAEYGGAGVQMYYSTDPDALNDPDHASWVSALAVSGDNAAQLATIAGVQARGLAIKVELRSDGAGAGTPSVYSFATRAYPGAGDLVVELPVLVSDTVEIPGRHPLVIEGYGERLYQELKLLERQAVLLELYSPAERIRGTVEMVSTPLMGHPGRGSTTLYSLVRIRGRRVNVTSSEPTGVVWGSDQYGSYSFGGG